MRDTKTEYRIEYIKDWIEKIREETPEEIIIYLVANKIDKNNQRTITNEQGTKLAKKFKIPYFETSAKCSIGVDAVFESLVKQMDDTFIENHKEELDNKVKLGEKNKKKKKCC